MYINEVNAIFTKQAAILVKKYKWNGSKSKQVRLSEKVCACGKKLKQKQQPHDK